MSDLEAERALDVEIAEQVMGLALDWDHAEIRAIVAKEPEANHGRGLYCRCMGCDRHGYGNEVDWAERCPTPVCPPYSTELDAAWAVVGRLKALGYWCKITENFGTLGPVCVFIRRKRHRGEVADTVAEAICQAALAALAQRE